MTFVPSPPRRRPTAVAKLIFNAGEAKPGPPVGPVLAQFQLNIANVCRELNDLSLRTYNAGVPVPARIFIFEDRSYRVALGHPSLAFLCSQFTTLARGQRPLTVAEFFDATAVYCLHRSLEPSPPLLRQLFGSLRSFHQRRLNP